MVQPIGRLFGGLLQNRKVLLSYEPGIALLSIHLKGLKTYVHTKACTQTLTAALFIIAKTRKQPGRPSVGN